MRALIKIKIAKAGKYRCLGLLWFLEKRQAKNSVKMEEILPPEIMEHIFERFKYCSYCEPLKTTYHKLQTKCIEKNLSKCSKTWSRWSQIVQGINNTTIGMIFQSHALKMEKILSHRSLIWYGVLQLLRFLLWWWIFSIYSSFVKDLFYYLVI